MKQFRGIPFNVSVFRMETGQELFSVQLRTNDDKIMKFNLGEKSVSNGHIPALSI